MSKQERRKFTAEYKREAVNMVLKQRLSVAEAARRLGVAENMLHRWKKEFSDGGNDAIPGPGQQTAMEEELARLRSENERLRMERDILKKATVFFAKESK